MTKFEVGAEVVGRAYQMQRRSKGIVEQVIEHDESNKYYITYAEEKELNGWFEEWEVMNFSDYKKLFTIGIAENGVEEWQLKK